MMREKIGMMRRFRRKTLCALDIGTTKVCAIIANLDEEGRLHVLGAGTYLSPGISRGDVIDIDQTVEAIQRAVEQAEDLAKLRVSEVIVGIAGDHIQSNNLEGSIAIPHYERGVDERDRKRVIQKVKDTVSVPNDMEIIHAVVQSYITNGNSGVLNPIHIATKELGVRIHMVLASMAAVHNITRCVRRAGLRVQSIALESLASSMSVLSNYEKDMGVALLDIGGGTTDFAVFKNGCIASSGEVVLGGNSITQDIQYMWKISFHDAEHMKKKLGAAVPMNLDAESVIEIPPMQANRKAMTRRSRELAMFIEARVEEILTLTRDKIANDFDLEDLHAGIVLTGGTAMLTDIEQVAERIFGARCRIGHPQGIRGLSGMLNNSPIYSTAVGLLLFGFAEESANLPWWKTYYEKLLPRREQAFA